MRPLSILTLPLPLLLLLAAAAPGSDPVALGQVRVEWPYSLPSSAKYWPERDDPAFFSRRKRGVGGAGWEAAPRDDEGSEKARTQPQPVKVRKMSHLDPGEKFWPGADWGFDRLDPLSPSGRAVGHGGQEEEEEEEEDVVLSRLRPRNGDEYARFSGWWNGSALLHSYKPPFMMHLDDDRQAALEPGSGDAGPRSPHDTFRRSKLTLRQLQGRAFQCPGGTSDCSAIGRPNSCCALGEKCEIITDTGLGDVGCCPTGKDCSGDLKNCDLGFTKCGDSLGGGCCIPLYTCIGIGCGPGPSLVSLVLLTPTPLTTPTTAPAPQPNTAPQTTLPCSPSFRACPASLGGGCCRTDRLCGALDCPATSTSSPSPTATGAGAAVRPNTTPAAVTTITAASCPVGYYPCLARYAGGCCQVGRNCDSASCPPSAVTTVVNSAGVTVVEPVGGAVVNIAGVATTSAVATTAAQVVAGCAQGWFGCQAQVGGGCCPGGFLCETDSCFIPGASGKGVPKGSAVAGGANRIGKGGWRWGVVLAIVVVLIM